MSSTLTTKTTQSAARLSAAAAPEVAVAETTAAEETSVPAVRSFDEMPLPEALSRGVYSHGFETPSPIQQRAIVPMLRGGDIIAQAQSGTGKTGAFTIGMLGRIDFRRMGTPQGLVLSPSRELAQQTYDVVTSIGEYLAGGATFCQLLVGGTRVVDDIRRLQGGATTVAVGCPGRVADLLRRGAMRADGLRVVVLDEADEMLSQGFAEQVYGIFRFLPKDVQVALFSATLPPDVLALASRFMREPTRILVAAETLTLKGIKQFYVAVADEAEKMVVLTDLYESVSVAQSVVFCGHRRKVDYVADEMNRGGHTVSRMHSELQRGDREKVMAAFRGGSSRVLVTTDLVGRGIDVQHVNVVINYDMPSSAESYLHRIGRSGRYGRRGIAISFVTERDVAALQAIEAHFRTTVAELPSDFARYLSEDDDHS